MASGQSAAEARQRGWVEEVVSGGGGETSRRDGDGGCWVRRRRHEAERVDRGGGQ
jgi:hypothetical protein